MVEVALFFSVMAEGGDETDNGQGGQGARYPEAQGVPSAISVRKNPVSRKKKTVRKVQSVGEKLVCNFNQYGMTVRKIELAGNMTVRKVQ
jgi:hypothetical protein